MPFPMPDSVASGWGRRYSYYSARRIGARRRFYPAADEAGVAMVFTDEAF